MSAPDLDMVAKFLAAIRPRGPHTLSAIHPERQQMTWADAVAAGVDMDVQRIHTTTFGEGSMACCLKWVERENAERNIYFSLNPCRPQAFTRKASQYIRKATEKRPGATLPDILAHQYTAFDIDLPADGFTPETWEQHVREKLARTKLAFTLIWRSGGGVQAAIRIKPAVPLETDDEVRNAKAINQGVAGWLAEQTGLKLDSIDNIDRVLRVCGTVNWPDARKRAKGRVPILAGPFTHNASVTRTRDALPQSAKAKAARGALYNNTGLVEPPGGWDHPDNIPYAVLHLQHTKDLAAEGVSGTAIRTAAILRDWGVSETLALDLMLEHWVDRCEYQFKIEELRSKINTAYRIAQNDPGVRTVLYKRARAQNRFDEARREFANE